DLSERIHKCPFCGLEIPRDYNSALEVKNLMLLEIGQELSESTLVKMELLPTNLLACSVNETRSHILNNKLGSGSSHNFLYLKSALC
ncbi:MAG: hypothetical protein Q8O03_05705, partial [Nanoarchaeota archaeon]|nr:hypothetical protein [Nanoarchaeota archaeon]